MSILTEIEIQILLLICDELTSKEIADKMCLSVRTIDTHRYAMLKKLNCKSVVGLIKYAYDNGFIKLKCQSESAIIYKIYELQKQYNECEYKENTPSLLKQMDCWKQEIQDLVRRSNYITSIQLKHFDTSITIK